MVSQRTGMSRVRRVAKPGADMLREFIDANMSRHASVSASVGQPFASSRYRLTCVCLLALAAALRFYDLPAQILSHDEAVTAEISQGTVLEIIRDTRHKSSSPILYPLLLSIVQTVDSSPLALRLVPAIASVLTVAALLFWLPRIGIAPAVALLAGLLATLCEPFIQHAQNAREYSLDTLVATLLLIGLLRCLHDGRKALLCAALAIAPLVQYGLVLFGAAVLATLALSSRAAAGDVGHTRLRERLGRAATPAGWFALGSAVSYAVTLSGQGLMATAQGVFGPFPQSHLYGGAADVPAMIGFAVEHAADFVARYAPTAVAAVGVVSLAILLVRSIALRRALSPVPMLCLLAGAVAVAAALLQLYPLGGIRQCMYLAPALFVGIAYAIHAAVSCLPTRPRHALTAMVAAIAAIEGGSAVAQGFPYQFRGESEAILAVLDEHVGDDPVYLPSISVPIMHYYYSGQMERFHQGSSCAWRENRLCEQQFVMELRNMQLDGAERVWVVFFNYLTWNALERWRDAGLAEHEWRSEFFNLFLIPNIRPIVAQHRTLPPAEAAKPPSNEMLAAKPALE